MKSRIYLNFAFGILLVVPMQSNLLAQSAGESVNTPSRSTVVKQRARAVAIELANSEAQLELTDRQIESQSNNLQKKTVSDVAFDDVFRMLHIQNAELTIELEGLNARLVLLKREAEAAISRSGKSDESGDKVQRELLKKYVTNQQKVFDFSKRLHEKGARSVNDLVRAEQDLIEAQLRLTEFENRPTLTSPALSEATFETSLEVAEKNARHATVKKMLQNYGGSRSDYSKLEILKKTRESLAARLVELSVELAMLESAATD